MRRAIALATITVATIAGCLFPSLDDLKSPSDASSGLDALGDVLVDAAPRCDPTKPFATPVPIPGPNNTSADEVTPRYSADERTLLFSRFVGKDDAGVDDFDLYIATRASNQVPFDDAVPITELNSPEGDYDPFLLADGLTLYFSSDRPDSSRQRMYVATRTSTSAPFSAPIDIGALDLAASYVGQSYFLPESTAYVADTDNGGVFTATAQSGTFTAPVLVPGLPDSGIYFPALTNGALSMFVGASGDGDDVFVATRSAITSPFGALSPVPELNTSFDDDPTWVSADGCVMLLVTDRPSGANYEMYFALRGF